MASIIGLFENGTTGAMDGDLISRADAETNAYAFAALDTEYTLHYRVIDDTTLDDPGEDANATITITAPTGVQVSAESGSGYGSSDTFPAATGGNQPVYAKQTARQASAEADIEVGTGGVAFATGTRLAAPADIVATPDSEQVALAWTAVEGATGHQARYRTAAVGETPAGAWEEWVATTTSASHTFAGLTSGVEYDFEVTAWDANGRGAAAAAAAAALQPPVISGTLVATMGDVSASLAGPTATGTITKWQYSTNGTDWTDVASTNATFPTTTVAALTPGTSYTFYVRAVNNDGNSENRTDTESTVYTFADDFSSLNTDRWTVTTATDRTVTVTSGRAEFSSLNSSSSTGGNLLLNSALPCGSVARTVYTKGQLRSTSSPPANGSFTLRGNRGASVAIWCVISYGTTWEVRFYHWNDSGTLRFWNYSTNAWNASYSSNTKSNISTNTDYRLYLLTHPTNGVAMQLTNADGTSVVETTGYVTWAGTNGSGTDLTIAMNCTVNGTTGRIDFGADDFVVA